MKPPQLGDRVREVVTGRTGIVTGYCEYLWGCEQLLVYIDEERDKNGSPKSEWYDIARLEGIQEGVVQAVNYETSEKPTSAFRGADLPAPRR